MGMERVGGGAGPKLYTPPPANVSAAPLHPRNLLFPLFHPVVTGLAQALQVRAIKETANIAAMRHDMIGD